MLSLRGYIFSLLVFLMFSCLVFPSFIVKTYNEHHLAVFERTAEDNFSLTNCVHRCALTKGCGYIQVVASTNERLNCITGTILCSQELEEVAEAVDMVLLPELSSETKNKDRNPNKVPGGCQGYIPVADVYQSCTEALASNQLANGTYKIRTMGMSTYYNVECHWRYPIAVVLIGHDTESEFKVAGGEKRASIVRLLNYSLNMEAVNSLVASASSCRQYVYARCSAVHFMRNNYTWLTGPDRKILSYWGGGDPVIGGCQCGINGTCYIKEYQCNCNANENVVLVDEGFISKKSDLPITGGWFGDTGDVPKEYIYFRVGKLECVF